MIKIKRVYEKPDKDDGFRILVDRLWPRGLTRECAGVDLWLKDIAPSTELRKWFSHDPQKWEEFKRRYRSELKGKKELIQRIKEIERKEGVVTLLYSAKDREHNNAVFLKDFLERV